MVFVFGFVLLLLWLVGLLHVCVLAAILLPSFPGFAITVVMLLDLDFGLPLLLVFYGWFVGYFGFCVWFGLADCGCSLAMFVEFLVLLVWVF